AGWRARGRGGGPGGTGGGVVAVRGGAVGGRLPREPAQLAAHQVARPVPGEQVEVGAESPCRWVVAVRMAPKLDEDVLDDILRRRALTENPKRGPVDGRRQVVEGLRERVVVSGRQARRQERIRRFHASENSALAHG